MRSWPASSSRIKTAATKATKETEAAVTNVGVVASRRAKTVVASRRTKSVVASRRTKTGVASRRTKTVAISRRARNVVA